MYTQDDLEDVMDISDKIQDILHDILVEHEYAIGFASLNLAVFQLLYCNASKRITNERITRFCNVLNELKKVN